ncbi:MAG: LysR family transcriptional regulator [Ardenticatenaceae bacterium]|nr:LysR family transcriptional regulator [Ardenticatenaceae bacterium]
MIDLTRLETFIFAAEHLSFSEAARHLHVTQPTISHHIKALETDLNVQLFDRAGTALQLTEAGRLLLPWARKLVRQAIELEDLMTSTQQEVVGQLRIACSTTAGKYVLPQLAARFCHQYPGIRVKILACTSEHVIPNMLEGEANLGVVSSYDYCQGDFECQEFFSDAIALIVPKDHAFAKRPYITPDEILNQRLLSREPTSGTRRVLMTELAKHDISVDDLNIFLELGNTEAIVRTVQAGFGIAFVSSLAAECPIEQGQLVAVPVEGLELKRKIYMIRPRLEAPNRPQEVFWSFIHDPANADLIHLPETG